MYYYLYDTFLSDKKYDKVLDQIKTKLLDLDIKGKHEKLSLLKDSDTMIADEIKRGAKSVVVVGNDKTFLKAVDVVARYGATLGIIPIGPNNKIASIFGINGEEQACEILAARKVAQFDLGQVNNVYFFSNLTVQKDISRISVSHQGYKVIPRSNCSSIAIYNFLLEDLGPNKLASKINPQDQLLDLVLMMEKKQNGFSKYLKNKNNGSYIDSVIQGINFEVKSFEYLPLMVDDYRVIKTPAAVKLADKKLKVIIGKTKKLFI